ncbi:hypothetical protein BDF20DRAFT_824445 [Mycotypha africana]|uniref:uncharacterized protein n=1 Tax=Mycotypha africana TaxID=64632 RepID=UPI00230054B5|nr:uncharacterized protein BDF20DRAFT_824445 [Mycotypha africana]KAI8971825.1 hypothetical protein BDF20DRAFT_824445 [Mycotypha africana]
MKVSSIPSHYQEATMTATDKKRDTGFVDFLNLYVKNLDPTVDNSDLFNLFRKFGRIVSARVMTNPQNGQSKGYGFVSFGKHEEAAAALEEMNGYQFRTKPIIVAYHEPKKPRQEKSSSTATSSFHSPPPPNSSLNVVGPLNGLGIDHVDQLSMNIKVEELSVGTSKAMRVKQHKQREYPIYCQDYTNAVNGFPGTKKPSLRRRRSLESINSTMTESTAQIQRHRMTEAVKRCCMEIPALTMIVTNQQEQQINDIVDMLLTLRKKERSICLFNREFLKEKVQAAVEALEICEDEAEDEEEILLVDLKEATNTTGFNTTINSIPTATNDDVIIPPRQSKAIPIVAPNHLDATKQEEIRALLNSLEGKPIHEKKQQLGDQLFPLVKVYRIHRLSSLLLDFFSSLLTRLILIQGYWS